MDHPVVRLGFLFRRVKRVETRKKFQKLIHILQVMGAPFPESYDFHLYGPYSTDLRCELDAFAAEKLIVEEEQPTSGTPISVAGTPKLQALLDECPNLTEPNWVAWAAELNEMTTQTLEGISTILYLYQRGWDRATWKGKFEELKPQIARQFPELEAESLRLLKVAGRKAA